MKMRLSLIIMMIAIMKPGDCFPQTRSTDADEHYFRFFPSSITAHVFDRPTWLATPEHHIRKVHPEYPKTTFEWSTTIGRLIRNAGSENLFFPGPLPGHGQISIIDTLTHKSRLISINVLPSAPLDYRSNQEVSINPVSHDLLSIFTELCSVLRSPCGIENPTVAANSRNLESQLAGVRPDKVSDEVARLTNRYIDTPFVHVKPIAVLDAIDKQSSDYQWTQYGGVLNLIPKPGKGGAPSILETRIAKPVTIQGLTAANAIQVLFQSAGINAKVLSSPGISKSTGGAIISMTLQDKTLRECLNEIVRADGHAIWQFSTTKDGNYVYDISHWGQQ
jgi:hypothetical protein